MIIRCIDNKKSEDDKNRDGGLHNTFEMLTIGNTYVVDEEYTHFYTLENMAGTYPKYLFVVNKNVDFTHFIDGCVSDKGDLI